VWMPSVVMSATLVLAVIHESGSAARAAPAVIINAATTNTLVRISDNVRIVTSSGRR
jgi:hypothetical protein